MLTRGHFFRWVRLSAMIAAVVCGWAPQAAAAWSSGSNSDACDLAPAEWSEDAQMGLVPDVWARAMRPERETRTAVIGPATWLYRSLAVRQADEFRRMKVRSLTKALDYGCAHRHVGVVELKL